MDNPAARGRISRAARRTGSRPTLAAGLAQAAALLAGLLLAALSGARPGPARPPGLPPDLKLSDCPSIGRHGGRLVLCSRGGPKTFNSLVANEVSSSDITNRMFDPLVDYNHENLQIVPALARSWERSRDGRTWTFHLRHARFSDGSPITSADVLFTYEVVYDPRVHPSTAELAKVRGQKFDISAPDDSTVVFRLPESYGMFLDVLAAVSIMPRARLETALREGRFESAYGINTPPAEVVGSGPWRLKQFVPGEKVVLERSPYWYEVDRKGQRLPYLEELVWLVVPDQNAELLKFESGAIDAMDGPRPADFARLTQGQRRGGYRVHDLGVSLSTVFLWFNLNLKPDLRTPCADPVKYRWFSDANFRRALALSIDQKKMIRLAYMDRAAPNWGPSTGGNRKWFDPNVKEYGYDPLRARRLLAAAGFADRNRDGWLEDRAGNKVQFSIITNADNTLRQMLCSLLKTDFRQVGVDLTVAPLEFNALLSRVRESRDYDAAMGGLQGGVPPDPALGQNVWKSSGKTHFWYVEQPHPSTPWEAEIDSLMDEVARVDEYPKRKKMWDRIQEIVTDQAVFLYLPSEKAYLVARDRIGNLRPTLIPHRVLWNSPQLYLR